MNAESVAAPMELAHVLAGGFPLPGSYTTIQLYWYPAEEVVVTAAVGVQAAPLGM